MADLHYMKDVNILITTVASMVDKGYIGADVQLDLFETAHIRFWSVRIGSTKKD